MTYQPSHRRPRWHDRPRAWLRRTFGRLSRWEEEEQPLTDDHGNHIGGDLPDYQYGEPAPGRVWQAARLDDGTLLPVDGEPAPPGYNPTWMNCAFTPEVPREEVMPVERAAQDGLHLHDVPRRPLADVPRPEPGGSPTGATSALLSGRLGLGYRQNVPRPVRPRLHSSAGPGHLTMWDLVHVRSPWPPRTWPPVLSGPRIRPELRGALLAGTT